MRKSLYFVFFVIFTFIIGHYSFSTQRKAEILKILRNREIGDYSVKFDNISSGQTILEISPEKQLIPASNLKLFTSAAILDFFGPNKRLETLVETNREKGKFSLKITGIGDPTFSSRFNQNPFYFFDKIGQKLKKMNISEIETIFLETSLFSSDKYPLSWPDSDKTFYYAPAITPFIFNDNCIDFSIKEDSGRFSYTFFPNMPTFFEIENNSQIIEKEGKFLEKYTRHPDSRKLLIKHQFPAFHTEKEYLSVPYPNIFFGEVLKQRLQKKHNISVKVLKTGPNQADQQIVWKKLFTNNSVPISRLISVINQKSNNLFAETISRTAAAKKFEKSASLQDSCLFVENFAKSSINEAISLSDCCGLSRKNKLSTAQICLLLKFMTSHPHFQHYRNSLSQPGKSGSLRKRLKDLPGQIFAKTGSLSKTQALSGYYLNKKEIFSFSIILNNSPHNNEINRNVCDKILKALVK